MARLHIAIKLQATASIITSPRSQNSLWSNHHRRLRTDQWLPLSLFLIPHPTLGSFPSGSAGKESAYNVGDLGSIPGLGRFPGEGKGYPLQYSGLENSMDCIVLGVAKSQTWLSDFHSINSNSGLNGESQTCSPNQSLRICSYFCFSQ